MGFRRCVFFCVLGLLSFLVPVALAEPPPQSPTAFRDRLYDITFLSEKEVLVVGYPGKVFRSADAGQSWELIPIKTREPLFAVDFVDDKEGWISGRKGQVFHSEDGGRTWTRQETGASEYLFDIRFFDRKRGIAVGNFGTIIRTSDGGKTWAHAVLEPMSSASLYAAHWVNENLVYIAGENPTWEAELEVDVSLSSLSSVFRSRDAGASWELVKLPDSSHIFDIAFTDESTGYVVGSKGLILKTEDGAASWTRIETDTSFHLLNIVLRPGGLIVTGNAGTVLKVEGDHARSIPTGGFYWLTACDFNQGRQGVLVGNHGLIMVSGDAGRTWQCVTQSCKIAQRKFQTKLSR